MSTKNNSIWTKIQASQWVGLIVGFFVLYATFNQHTWDRKDVIQHDVRIYYEVLPATFEFGDPLFGFVDSLRQNNNYDYWTFQDSITGKRYMKYTIGLAYLYAPAYLAVKAYYHFSGGNPDPFDVPFHFAVVLSTLIFGGIGFFYSRKVLKHFFPDNAVALMLLIIFMGTGVWHYLVMSPGYGHIFSFGLISAAIWQAISYAEKGTRRKAYLLGFLLGIITLIRPTNLVIFLVVFALIPASQLTVSSRIKFWWTRRNHWIPAVLFFLIPIIPQLLLWKTATNHWLINSYGKEGFFFLNPHILDGLFSFRNGFFTYSPVLLLFFPGLFFMYKQNKSLCYSVSLFFLLNAYFMYSWWCWWYGGSFGSRPQIDSLLITVIPIGYLAQQWGKSKRLSVGMTGVVVLFCGLNVFQSYQAEKSIIHWDSMTYSSYKGVFGKTTFPFNYADLIQNPDYENAVLGNEYPIKIDTSYLTGVVRINPEPEYFALQKEPVNKWTSVGVTKVYGTIYFQ